MKKHYDIAIIGAGPAGTSCALALKTSGLSVALIDKSNFPRNKTCSDAIPGPTLKFLNQIHEPSVEEFNRFEYKQQIKSSILYLANGDSMDIEWKGKAYNSQRISFDNFLLDQVKKHTETSIYEGIRIKDIYKKEGKIFITGIATKNVTKS